MGTSTTGTSVPLPSSVQHQIDNAKKMAAFYNNSAKNAAALRDPVNMTGKRDLKNRIGTQHALFNSLRDPSGKPTKLAKPNSKFRDGTSYSGYNSLNTP
jgi:hypothetical protein